MASSGKAQDPGSKSAHERGCSRLQVIRSCVPHRVVEVDIVAEEERIDRVSPSRDIHGDISLGAYRRGQTAGSQAQNAGDGNAPRGDTTAPARARGQRRKDEPSYQVGDAAHGTSLILPSLRQRLRRRGPSNLSFFGNPATLFRASGT